ncbi:putative regulator of chromosome condensation; 48393-44372 [Arabidopsis thaliana]|nr:Regulator of chromosome condensation (RCC1) family with FYVE zinc finger domain-containing protein [Arabidopsis thaliana]AAG52535.1 putative regulator of chromosome condensation; 48393-44372 [Arabidopsis thaliana]ANM60226.1 Regulator of chromosome condensation (RCC1) family with FYVE zinc finger domain-containing protein [Arabidopsis thaliana]|eukprot:NP_001322526.1 Regulator of chromosome condensation (RCC1) family with FYVE zinc finger domain-containing protein [Arabidopsis thaliana]
MADSLRTSFSERDVEQAITSLKKGSYLLKYGRRGKPKFCPFQLTSDESALVWYSGKEEKQIKLSQVLRIVPGQRTPTFKRYPRPEKEYQSFSLICPDRSLDLICKDKDEAEVWVVGLKSLITRVKVSKWKTTIKPEITSAECPTPHARRVSPFVTILDQVIQPSNETSTQTRLGKVFSDIVAITAPPSNNNQTEASGNLFCPFSPTPANVENSNLRFSTNDPFRLSLSSAVSTSSHGSYHEDFDALGDVFVWGESISDGVLSGTGNSLNSTTEDALLPKALESTIVLDAQNIACGKCHAVLVTKQGEIFSWGEGKGGKLGHGLETDAQKPKFISSVRGLGFKSLACGDFHTCAITQSGDLYSWGDGTHNVDLLGHGNESSCWIPKRVTGDLQGLYVSDVACGPWHTAVVASSGQLFTFGDGTFGALGHGDRRSTSVPREVESLIGLIVTKVACGVWHTAAVVEVTNEASEAEVDSSRGQVFTWGDGEKGQLGHGDNDTKLLPECVISLTNENICQVACGHSLTVSRTSRGHVYTMGSTAYGQLGNPTAKGNFPERVEGDIVEASVEEIACGSYHVAVLTSKSEIYTWGKGLNGQLGHGNVENKREPAVVGFLREKQVKAITCGSNFTAVICVHKWVPGSEHSLCAGCRNPFNFRRKRHNCYNCGLVFCKVCSSRKSLRAALAPDMNKPYRVCYGCFTKLKKSRESSPSTPTSRTRKLLNMRKSTDVSERDSLTQKFLSVNARLSSADSSLHYSERRHHRRDLKPEVNNSNVFPSMNGSLQPVGSPFSKGSTALPKIPKNMMVKIPGSGMSSRTTSPVSVKSTSPRRSYEVAAAESKQLKDSFNQDMAGLKEQVEQLASKAHQLEEELEKTKRQLKVVTAMAADEAEENRSAKEVIRSLTTQLKEMAEKQSQKDSISTNSKHTDKEKSETVTQTSNQTHIRSMVSQDSQNENNLTSKSFANGHRKQNDKPEKVVQDEPGVYLTLLSLPGGGTELKRVRFSRKQFTEEQAEKWWGENGAKVCERHNILVS